jgi:chorismate synthase
VVAIGEARHEVGTPPGPAERAAIERSEFHVDSPAAEAAMKVVVDRERERGGSVGGLVEVWAEGLPIGLGSYAHPDRRLDARLAAAVAGVQAIKAVEFGEGTRVERPGVETHDALFHSKERGFWRETNRAGGLEGGMTNGSPLRVRAYMKPIPTMLTPLPSVDLVTRAPVQARYERSDVCAVPAAAVVVEAVVAWELAAALLEKFGGDTLGDLAAALEGYAARIR